MNTNTAEGEQGKIVDGGTAAAAENSVKEDAVNDTAAGNPETAAALTSAPTLLNSISENSTSNEPIVLAPEQTAVEPVTNAETPPIASVNEEKTPAGASAAVEVSKHADCPSNPNDESQSVSVGAAQTSPSGYNQEEAVHQPEVAPLPEAAVPQAALEAPQAIIATQPAATHLNVVKQEHAQGVDPSPRNQVQTIDTSQTTIPALGPQTVPPTTAMKDEPVQAPGMAPQQLPQPPLQLQPVTNQNAAVSAMTQAPTQNPAGVAAAPVMTTALPNPAAAGTAGAVPALLAMPPMMTTALQGAAMLTSHSAPLPAGGGGGSDIMSGKRKLEDTSEASGSSPSSKRIKGGDESTGTGDEEGLLPIGDDGNGPPPVPASNEGTTIFHDADVLSGRGGGTNVHPGNRNFRDLINLHRRAYLKARKNDKPAISRAIVRSVREANGRFLKKDEKTGLWFEIGDDAAREKTSQALRQRAPEMRKLLFDTEREEARAAAQEQMQRQQRMMMGMPPDGSMMQHPGAPGMPPNGAPVGGPVHGGMPGVMPGGPPMQPIMNMQMGGMGPPGAGMFPNPAFFAMQAGKNGMPQMPPGMAPNPEAYQQMFGNFMAMGGGMNPANQRFGHPQSQQQQPNTGAPTNSA